MTDANSVKKLRIALLVTAMFAVMGGPVLAPALPAIKAAYHTTPDIEFWAKTLIAITGLFSAIGAPLFGWISDRWSRKRTLILALICWGVSGSSGLVPQPFWMLLAGRGLFGLSLGGLLVANTALIAEHFDRDQRRHMMGLQSAFCSIGTVMSLVFSGWLADLHWRCVFGIFLTAFAVLPLVISCPESPERPSTPRRTASSSRLPAGLLLVYGYGVISLVGFAIIPTQFPFFAHGMGVQSASYMGLLIAVTPLTSALAGRIYARLSRDSEWYFFLVAGSAFLVGFSTLALSTNLLTLILGLAGIGTGFGLTMPHLNILLTRIVHRESQGRAMGILASCKFMGQFLSPILLQPVLVHGGYRFLFLFSGSLMLVAAIVVWGMGKRIRPEAKMKDSS
jgi:MFS family permease